MSDSHEITVSAPQALAPTRMHPLVQVAMSQAMTPETMREMLQLQREYQADESKRAYVEAMVELKRDLPSVLARDKTVSFGNTRYQHTTLAAAVDACTPALVKHGFSLSWVPGSAERGGVTVSCEITHRDGHTERASLTAPADTSGSKNPAQAVASTVTLLSRHLMLSLLGIATRDHVDPEPAQGSKVDAASNAKAVSWLKSKGLALADAEAHIGRVAREWTAEDLATVKRWATAATVSAPAMREMGDE